MVNEDVGRAEAAVPEQPPGGGVPPPPAVAVPNYAWDWLQRSRPVLSKVALELTGAPPAPGFVDRLRREYSSDPFIRGVIGAAVAEVAFAGRPPGRRPKGARWDRGLTWWAATLAGVTPAEFERRDRDREREPHQASLFEPGDRLERTALANALRGLLNSAHGGQVPAQAIRRLLAQLES